MSTTWNYATGFSTNQPMSCAPRQHTTIFKSTDFISDAAANVNVREFENEYTLPVVVNSANYFIRTGESPDYAPITHYDSKVIPGFSFENYVSRLKAHFQCSDAALILAMVYVTKVMKSMNICLTERNVHRVYLVCLLIACKFIEDHFYTNSYYAKSGGVTLEELNRLEVQTLKEMRWSFWVQVGEYENFIRGVMGSAAGNPYAVVTPYQNQVYAYDQETEQKRAAKRNHNQMLQQWIDSGNVANIVSHNNSYRHSFGKPGALHEHSTSTAAPESSDPSVNFHR